MDKTSSPDRADHADTFDATAYEDVASGDLRIKDPLTGEPLPMVITLAGPEHPDRKRLSNLRLRRLRADISKTGRMPVRDPLDDDAEQTDELVACTLGWTGFSTPYSRDAARALYTDPKRRWLRDQVATGLQERELFIRRCATA